MSFITDEEARGRLYNSRNLLRLSTQIIESGSHILENTPEVPAVNSSSTTQLDSPSPDSPSPDSPLPDSPSPEIKHEINHEKDPFTQLKMAKAIDELLDTNNNPGRKVHIRNRTTPENASVGLSRILLGGRAVEDLFGVDPIQSDHITRGYVSSNDRVAGRNRKEDLLDEIYSQGQDVAKRAFNRLLKSLDLLDDDKLESVKKGTELVQIAKGLSGIIRDVTPREESDSNGGGGVHFHIYRPEQNTDDHYETLEVGADGSVSSFSSSRSESGSRPESE